MNKFKVLLILMGAFLSAPSFSASKEITCLTDMTYFETKGSTTKGNKSVIDVMFNRVNSKLFPNTICKNIAKKGQYPWYGKGINRSSKKYKNLYQLAESEYAKFKLGEWRSSVGAALYFNAHRNHKPTPSAVRVTKIEGHTFYLQNSSYIGRKQISSKDM